jgi:hypothetical protein
MLFLDTASKPEDEVKGIPGFWLQALTTNNSTSYLITEEDVPALESLVDIGCEYDDEFTSFKLSFYFKENEFFTNKILTKTYGVSPDLLDDKSPALTLNEGTEIDWKAGKNLTVVEEKKKQKAKSGKNKGQVRTVITTIPKASFFHYFGEPREDDDEDDEDDDKEEDEAKQIKLTMEEDYDIGHTIRTIIIPEAVLWYIHYISYNALLLLTNLVHEGIRGRQQTMMRTMMKMTTTKRAMRRTTMRRTKRKKKRRCLRRKIKSKSLKVKGREAQREGSPQGERLEQGKSSPNASKTKWCPSLFRSNDVNNIVQ